MVNPVTGTVQEGVSRLLAPAETSELEKPTDDTPEVTPDEPEVEAEIEEEIPEEVIPAVEGDDVTEAEEPKGQPEVTHTVSVGGEEQEVSVDELRLGYMRDADYRQKTIALADQRKADDATREAFQGKLEQAELVATLDQEDLESPEAIELKEYDPAAYYAKKERADAKQARLVELRTEADTQRAAQRQANLAAEQELLLPAIPEWVDQAVRVEEIGMCQALWAKMGFTDADLEQLLDHRLVVLSRKAALYDRINAAKPEDKKVTTKPKSAQPGTVSTKGDKSRGAQKAARDRLRKTGKVADAVSLLLEK